jgi:hypothetical protein
MRNFLRHRVRCEVRARPLRDHSAVSSLPNARSRAALLGAGYPNLKRHKDVDGPVAAFLVELFPTGTRYALLSLPCHIAGPSLVLGMTTNNTLLRPSRFDHPKLISRKFSPFIVVRRPRSNCVECGETGSRPCRRTHYFDRLIVTSLYRFAPSTS